MLKIDFLNNLNKKYFYGPQVIKAKTISLRRLSKLHDFRNISAFLPFKCTFKNGRCDTEKDCYKGPSCCCVSCAKETGYLRYIPEETLYYYARKFDRLRGFWREKRGCILDRKYRSPTCLTYYCKDRYNQFDKSLSAYSDQLKIIEDEIAKGNCYNSNEFDIHVFKEHQKYISKKH